MILREEITSLLKLPANSFTASGLEASLTILSVLLIYLVFKNTIMKVLKKIIERSEHELIVSLSKSHLLRNISIMIPFVFLYALKDTFLNKTVSTIYEKGIFTTLVIIFVMFIFSIFNVLTELLETSSTLEIKLPFYGKQIINLDILLL